MSFGGCKIGDPFLKWYLNFKIFASLSVGIFNERYVYFYKIFVLTHCIDIVGLDSRLFVIIYLFVFENFMFKIMLVLVRFSHL